LPEHVALLPYPNTVAARPKASVSLPTPPATQPIGGSVPIRTSATMESAYELTSGGLSHETKSDRGLCSMVVPAVVHCEAQRTLVTEPLVEKTVTQLRLPV
jgi:hypothetical protein